MFMHRAGTITARIMASRLVSLIFYSSIFLQRIYPFPARAFVSIAGVIQDISMQWK